MKWNLRGKVLFLSTLAALLPFATTNIYWYFNSQNTIRKNAENTIVLTTSQAAEKVNDFINAKLLGVLAHSQGVALLVGDSDVIKEDLLHLLVQDPDIQQLVFVDSNGQEQVKVDKQHVYGEDDLKNVSNSVEFKIASFKFGKEYISPIDYQFEPKITIAVPVAYPDNAQSLHTFSSANTTPRNANEVRGVLMSTISLAELVRNLNTLNVGTTGDVYLSDSDGRLASYRDKRYMGIQVTDPQNEVMKNPPEPTELVRNSVSITGVPVLSSQQKIARTNWKLITEIPLSDISEDIKAIQMRAAFLSILPLSVLLVLSLYFARNLINPIRTMAKGAEAISQGDFDYNFARLKTGDELEQLANAYANMSKKIELEQNSLVSQKNTLSSILGSIVDGVIALDGSYKVIFSNNSASMIFGVHEFDLKAKQLDEVITFMENEERVSISELCRESSDTNKSHKLNYLIDTKHTGMVNLIISTVPPSPSSDIVYLLTFYDLSKEQEFENMKLDFVSMAAHELRTPLTAIKGYLAYLDEEVRSKLTEEELTYFSRVIISSDQLSSLVENLLNVAKIERGMFKLDLAYFSLEEMIDESLLNLREVAVQKKIKVDFEKPKTYMPHVLGDKFRVGQVFTNLVSNAINYTQPGGWVKISLDKDDKGVTVHVQDNGQGIPATSLPHLFTKFYRVGGALEQGSKGTGLGLFISKSIIDRHNGKIWVESEEGKGSTFSFQLPAQVSPEK